MKKTIKFLREYWRWFVVGIAIGAILSLFAIDSCACEEKKCKTENAECAINESGKECCEGLVCVPFNERSENGKCEPEETPTPTPPEPTRPTITPTDVPEVTPTNTPVPTAVPTNKPEPGPKDPPEKSDPCYWHKDEYGWPECATDKPLFPGESTVFVGPMK